MSQITEVWPGGMPEVGQQAELSRTVTRRDIELFTEISGGRNPLHYDEEIARTTRFGGIVVQGGVTSVREDKPITELETQVILADGTVVLDGTAVCYTMPIVC